jgi:hypothetical protein
MNHDEHSSFQAHDDVPWEEIPPGTPARPRPPGRPRTYIDEKGQEVILANTRYAILFPDVAAAFPDDAAVNAALRQVLDQRRAVGQSPAA